MNKSLLPLVIFYFIAVLRVESKNRFVLSKLKEYVVERLHSKVETKKINKDPMVKLLSSDSNFNKLSIAQKLVTNFELLPEELRSKLGLFEKKNEKLMAKCESIYGRGSCEFVNLFTVQKKCPEGLTREDHTRCVKECGSDLIKIDNSCRKQKPIFLSLETIYGEKEECEENTDRECVDAGLNAPSFIPGCEPHYKKIGSMCVPVCLKDMTKEQIGQFKQDKRYCVEETHNQGMPFYDV